MDSVVSRFAEDPGDFWEISRKAAPSIPNVGKGEARPRQRTREKNHKRPIQSKRSLFKGKGPTATLAPFATDSEAVSPAFAAILEASVIFAHLNSETLFLPNSKTVSGSTYFTGDQKQKLAMLVA